jgi:oxygen-independent coproporphyrinogen-3 oxidase
VNGIYIHIPYCRQKCHYCNFYSLASSRHRTDFPDALAREIAQRSSYLGGERVDSLYLGGGTPSLFGRDELMRIHDVLVKYHAFAPDAEVTLEANPDDLDSKYLDLLRTTPVNRLSIGVQSFRDEDLHYLNRVHSGTQAEEAVRRALDRGFDDLTIDLIFGIPTLDDQGLEYNIGRFAALGLSHLSAYALTVEPRTALEVMIRKGRMDGVDEAQVSGQFNLLSGHLTSLGFQHYEISSYARHERFARHNTNYWLGGKYIGYGPSAHSYDGATRQWNVAHMERYIAGVRSGKPEFELETLSVRQRYNEYIMVSLRTMWGTDPVMIRNRFGDAFLEYFETGIRQFLDRKMVKVKDGKLLLTGPGKLHADGIASDLFWPE